MAATIARSGMPTIFIFGSAEFSQTALARHGMTMNARPVTKNMAVMTSGAS